MPNHFHFLIKQLDNISIDKLITKVCTSYAKYFNKKYGRVGHVFQDTFKAKLVDNDSYLTYLSAYIHNNPVHPLEYDFSSFKDYIGVRSGTICEKSILLKYFDNDPIRYKDFVMGYDDQDAQRIQFLLFED